MKNLVSGILVRTISGLLVIAAAVMPALSTAQVLEEITVTAQKREQNLQDVGISVTAFSGDQLSALGMTNTVEITEQVPNLQMITFSPNLTVFNIRGVSQNNFTDNLEAPVAVYIDDAYLATMNGINAQMFDMERVEVLRGPQGTLFGRNATGGVIQYVTRGASDEETNGYVQAMVSDYSKYAVEGAFGGSFSDTARFRISGRKEESDGYIQSTDYPDGNPFPAGGQDLGGSNGYAVRAALEFDFGDSVTLDLRYKYSKDDEVPTGGYSFLPYEDNTDPRVYIPPEFEDFVVDVIGAPIEATADIFFCPSQLDCFTPVDQAGRTVFEGDHPKPFENYSDYAGFMDRETHNFVARLDWETSNGMDFVSITNYSTLDKFYTEDGDGIPVPIIEFTTVADFTQFSQEFRLAWETDSSRWQVGVYYLDMETKGDVATGGAPTSSVAVDLGFDPALLTDPIVVQDYTLDSRNWSLFGQAEFDLNDAFTLIAGLRWSQDDKSMDFETAFASPGDGILVPDLFNLGDEVSAAGGDEDTVDYGDYAARLQLDWRPSDDTLIFASWNRGIKGGNFAPSANVTVDRIRHDEEILNAYEIGSKSELAGGRARLNGTIFYYDYQDYQAFTFSDGTPSIANAQATNVGAEVELVWLPNDHWDISLGVAFQDSNVDDVETPQSQVTPVGFSVDWPIDFLDGVELPNAPKFAANYLVRYNWEMLGGGMAVQLDGAYYGEQYLEVSNGGGALQGAYNTVNGNISWENDNWRLMLWGRNLTDEVYKQYALDLGILGGTVVYAPPQWFGFTATLNF